MPTPPAVALVDAWHAALNAGDADRVVALSAVDVRIVGPRGTATGAAVLRDWVGRSGIRLQAERWFHRGNDVVVAQQATWRDPETGETGAPLPVATAFRVRDYLVARIARFDDLDAALADAEMGLTDELARA